jgi:hypothetical protein
MAASGGFLHQI